MGSIARIPKDQILDAALKMLIRDGYDSINIKTLAKELGCSTQPISWHFGSMPNLRKELTEAAFQYADKKMIPPPDDVVAIDRFREMGNRYIDLAYDEPNLARFLTEAHEGHTFAEQFIEILDRSMDETMSRQIADVLSVSVDQAEHLIQTLMLYVQGLVTMILSDRAQLESKEAAYEMIKRVGRNYMIGIGADMERADALRAS
ncbi:MAG: TetR/AcrR family transcriptional regulator [Schwartzia succinivorans]|jgi:AcrR family transcriptional regulator|uniref:TetR/AcrR family transcriptional regulator n=1 Tax=Schwartzia succinivorans TaxID=55507 RepID=UPI002355D94A|nr:TetR/AcrR family transcriptional regulator [Schwartzia succinivorans]MBE6096919.1 TetR/AcrR family transcriptional regulator [Schwartzia succinivorans]